MTRNYIRKTKTKYDYEVLKKAIESYKSGKKTSIYAASRQSSVPFATLQRWIVSGEPTRYGSGGIPVLNQDDEKKIIEALNYYAQCGIPLNYDAVCDMVQSYLKSVKKKNKFTNDRPGRDWFRTFRKRNEKILIKNKLEISTKCGKLTSSYKSKTFSRHYKKEISKSQLNSNPHCIFSLDEIVLTTDRKSKKLSNMHTVMFCKSVSGVYLPPFTLYNAKRINESWTKGGPKGAVYGASDSECMGNKNFENWFLTIFVKFVNDHEKPVLLTYSGHNCHLTYNTVRAAIENQIIILFPTENNTADLDIGVFPSAREEWLKILNSWIHKNQNSPVTKTVFPGLLKQLWESLLPAYDFEGFKDSGLYSPRKKATTQEVLTASTNFVEEIQSDVATNSSSTPIESPETQLRIENEEFKMADVQISKNVKRNLEQDITKNARLEEAVVQSLQVEQTGTATTQEDLTSSNSFEEDESAMSTIATSEPTESHGTQLKMINDRYNNSSMHPSEDITTEMDQDKKRTAKFEESKEQSLLEDKTRNGTTQDELTSTTNYSEELQSDIDTNVTNPETLIRIKDDEFQALSPQICNDIIRDLEQNTKKRARLDETVIQNLQDEQTNNVTTKEVMTSIDCFEQVHSTMSNTVTNETITSQGTPLSERNYAFENVSPQPYQDVTTTMEQNKKRRARFEEIMIQSLLEEQTN